MPIKVQGSNGFGGCVRADEPINEQARLAALHDHAILDTAPEQALDGLVTLTSQFLQAPISLISMVGKDMQWFKSKVGIDVEWTPRDQSFCAHAILDSDSLFEVPDTTLDPRTQDMELVIGPPHLRFYAGVPIKTSCGHALGTLCVLDRVPRKLSEGEKQSLILFARQVEIHLDLRKKLLDYKQSAQERDHLSQLLIESQATGRQGSWEFNLKTEVGFWTDGLYNILGISPANGVPCKEDQIGVWTAESAHRLQTAVMEAVAKVGRYDLELQQKSNDGNGKWFRSTGEAMRDENGEVTRVVGIITDIHDQKILALERNHLARMLQEAQATGKQGSWEFDVQNGRVFWTEGLYRILDLDPAQGPPTYDQQLCFYTTECAAILHKAVLEAVTNGTGYDLELQRKSDDGSGKWYRATGQPVRGEEGNIVRLVGTLMDITDRKLISDQLADAVASLEKAARTDHLTMLANRGEGERLFRAQAMEGPVSAILLDVDFFKSINDEFGHTVGDQVLKQISQTLSEVCPQGNVARWGGEEFLVTLSGVGKNDALSIAEEIRQRVQAIQISNRNITISAGVISTLNSQDQIEDLLDKVDRALYVCKASGRNCVYHVDDLSEEQIQGAFDLVRNAARHHAA